MVTYKILFDVLKYTELTKYVITFVLGKSFSADLPISCVFIGMTRNWYTHKYSGDKYSPRPASKGHLRLLEFTPKTSEQLSTKY